MNRQRRAKRPRRCKQLDTAAWTQMIIAVLGAVSAVAGCVAQFATW
jgi:hypothetical protein